MEKQAITIPGAKLYGPYTPGVKFNGIVWLSGQIDVDSGNDITSQTIGTLAKIDALLDAAGLTRDAICFAQVLLDDINDFAAMNDVYGKWVENMKVKPARAAFEAGALPAGAKVEIVVQAIGSNNNV
ncbi:MAG: RidA family protein [Candidatus Poseidoniaceae archaeon]|jgi:2-iminobutanoate/2-iminopropanoate deaminase|nr:RidA family protein [Candidatus Poseidoniaceae archaeon]